MASMKAVQDNCVRCHSALVSEMAHYSNVQSDQTNCIRCHSSVGHGANR